MEWRSGNLRFLAVLAFALLGAVVSLAGAAPQQVRSESGPKPANKSKDKVKKSNFAPEPAGPWSPPDVDAAVPPVGSGVSCPLSTVLEKAGERVKEMVSNLPKFAATEHMDHAELKPDGTWKDAAPVVFDYLVETHEVRPGMLVMEETRDNGEALDKFPARLATKGLPALALVFHPYFADDFEMRCEGRSNWDGYYAWQVHFQQRADKLPRLHAYRVKNLAFLLKLKGRAWISDDNFQVLHIDTDLMEPVPQVQYFLEHLSVDYRPVEFPKAKEELWLQQRAEAFMDVRGHRYRRVHTFTNFKLFLVETQEKVTLPKEP